MLKNYIKIAWRNLIRDKLYVITNIFGLATGIGVCFIIALYIQGELSYDNYHENGDRVYRIIEETNRPGNHRKVPLSSYYFSNALENDIPETQEVVTIRNGNLVDYFSKDNRQFRHVTFKFAESEIFEAFTIPLLYGTKLNILDEPNTVTISKGLAERVFGRTDVVGQNIDYVRYKSSAEDTTIIMTVTGVFEDIPPNSHLQFDALISFEHMKSTRASLNNSQFYNYLMLYPGADIEQVKQKIPEVTLAHYGQERVDYYDYQFHFQPLDEIYLGQGFADRNGSIEYISIFSVIAIFILFIAIINYTNLAVTRSSERAKEVGIRKVIGAHKIDLIKQFLGESMIYSMIAIPIAVSLVDIFLPYFNELLNSNIHWDLLGNYGLIVLVTAGVLIAGLVSAIYPAFIISSFKPSEVLKGSKNLSTGKGNSLRKALVVMQFAISYVLIISTLVISNQMDFIQNKNLGFDEEFLVSVDMGLSSNRPSDEVIKSGLESNPHVTKAAKSFGTPGILFATMSAPITRLDSTEATGQLNHGQIDADFVSAMGMNIIAGRDFNPENAAETKTGCLLNESAVKELGWTNPREAIGQQVEAYYSDSKTVIGVVEDFHFKSVHNEIEPLILMTDAQGFEFFTTINVRLKPGNLADAVQSLSDTWSSFNTAAPFEYQFLDEAIASLYEREQKTGQLFNFFSILAIIISCIGLLGLMAYTAQRRTKEIGIRKVMGATAVNIIALLSRDFVKLVILGFVIAIPIAWYAMNRWLEEFAYRTEMGPGVFLLAGSAAILIALLTVSWQSVKAALMNPVEALRSE